MPKLVWLNGAITPLEESTVSSSDHSFLYGDGLFEGIRFYDKRIYLLDEHLKRLYFGINYLGFKMPLPIETLRATVIETCRQADLPDGYIRLNVTRGTGLGLDPSKIDDRANVMIMISTLSLYPPETYANGISVVTSPIRVIPPDSLDPRVKCIGRYASNILAKQFANRMGAGDAMMLNQQGYVAEGTGNNVFFVKDGRIRTPHPSSGILEGCTRNAVMQLARDSGYEVTEELLTPYDVISSDEAFFTGTATEVMPFVSLDGQPIGTGRPGPITNRVSEMFRADVKRGVPFAQLVNERAV